MTIHRKTDDGRMIEITEEEAAAFAENMGEEMAKAKVMVEGCCYAAETMIPSLPFLVAVKVHSGEVHDWIFTAVNVPMETLPAELEHLRCTVIEMMPEKGEA